MPLPRLLLLMTGLSIILGLMLWLVTALYRLYVQIAFTSPLLANLLILLLLGLLGLLIATFLYYLNIFGLNTPKKRRPRAPIRVPAEKTAAAAHNLQAIRQQLAQIQDRVTQEALLGRSQAIEANLQRGHLQIAVFGTGSAGKTSLINALIGEMVGTVGATMGTTQMGQTYRLRLPGVARELWLLDTPGILEMGQPGQERERLAKDLATHADLLLFVVDNDLRQSEYEPLRFLAQLGKRALLVLNKIDLYTELEQAAIADHLRQQSEGLIAPGDVIAVAAHPQPVQWPDGQLVEPEPEIVPLLKRLATVIRAEGDDLLADNILLQSQQLGEEARELIDQQRRRQADRIIERYQWIGAGVIAVTPLPVLDMLATAAVNAQMVVEMGRVYGCEINSDRGKELALSLGRTLVSLGVVKGAVELLAKALQTNAATYLVGKAIQAVTAAYLTRIAGKSFVEYFRQDQDWGDGGISEVVQRQFQLSKKEEFVKGFVTEAITKVVQPLGDAFVPPMENLEEDDWETVPRRSEDW